MGEAEALVECKMQNLIVKLNDRRPGPDWADWSEAKCTANWGNLPNEIAGSDSWYLLRTYSYHFGCWKSGHCNEVWVYWESSFWRLDEAGKCRHSLYIYNSCLCVYIYYMLIIQSQFGIPNSCWTYIDPLLIVEHCIGRDLVLGVKNHRTKWWMAWPWPWLPEGKKSMDWLKGKSRGNHRFYHEDHGGFLGSCNFSLKPIHWRIGSKLQVVPGSLMSPVIFHQPRNRCATLR
jgi:hypothetical protein